MQKRFQNPVFFNLFLAVLFTNLVGAQIFHEAAHWAVMQLYGRGPVWGLTSLIQLGDREPLDPSQWVEHTGPSGGTGWLHLKSIPSSDAEWAIFLAVGPLAQVMITLIGLVIAVYARTMRVRTLGLLLALVNSFGLFFYQVVSGLRGGGSDETLLAYYLDISWLIVTVIFIVLSAAGFMVGMSLLSTARLRWKWFAALFLGMIPIGPLFMIANRLITDQVDANNPFFRPVFGFSLPVVLLALISVFAIAVLSRGWKPETIG